jgi:hypothetical protein
VLDVRGGGTPQRGNTDRRGGRGVAVACAVAAGGGALLAAGPAGAAVSITGSDADVWNAGSPAVRYAITSDTGGGRLGWALQELDPGEDGPMGDRPRAGTGRSPLALTLQDVGDGTFLLTAADRDARPVQRRFVVDRTAPAITIARPLDGATLGLGDAATADYSCKGAVRCIGSVAPGSPIDTSRAGAATFRVEAVDGAANASALQTAYTILAPTPAPPDPSAPATPAPPAPTTPATPVTPPVLISPGAVTVQPGTPRTLNAGRLVPHLNGVVHTARPTLRWPAIVGAKLFNVQVFRLRSGRAPHKVASVFPKRNRVRLPPRRLVDGARYAWRVWPYMRNGYTAAPLGLSLFSVRLRPSPR